MADPDLARLAHSLFWGALATYAVSMVLLLAAFAYRGRRVGSLGTGVAWLGLAVHIGSIVLRGVASSRVPWGNMFEYSNMIGALVVAGYLIVVDARLGMRQLGGFTMAFATLALGSAWLTYVPAGPLVPALQSIWLKIHVMAVIFGASLFTLSFIFAVLYLFKARAERRRLPVGSTVGAAYLGVRDDGMPSDLLPEEPAHRRPMGPFFSRLPSAEALDTLVFRTVQFAFPIWTFGVIAGAIWAHEAWGRWWAWDPKETWAFITWVSYAVYLHARATSGWRGSRAAWIAIAGYGTFLFNYFLVNTVMKGLHSYGT